MEQCRALSWSPTTAGCCQRYPGDLPAHHHQFVVDQSRPHTISSAHERPHMRSALSERTFEPMLQQPPHLHYHHLAQVQGGPHQVTTCCGNGGNGMPTPSQYAVMAHHRSLAMVAPRQRPHSLSRDDIIYQAMKGPQGPVPADGAQQPQAHQNNSVSESNSGLFTL